MWWYWVSAALGALVIGCVAAYLYKTKSGAKAISFEEIVGERCVVVDTVDTYVGSGLVKVKGQVWAARGVDDDDVFEVGENLNVVAIEGVKLICKKK